MPFISSYLLLPSLISRHLEEVWITNSWLDTCLHVALFVHFPLIVMSGLSLLSMHFKAMQIIVMLWTVSSCCYSCHVLNVSRYMQYIVSFHCCEIFWKAVSVKADDLTSILCRSSVCLSQSHWSGFFVRITHMGLKYIYWFCCLSRGFIVGQFVYTCIIIHMQQASSFWLFLFLPCAESLW